MIIPVGLVCKMEKNFLIELCCVAGRLRFD